MVRECTTKTIGFNYCIKLAQWINHHAKQSEIFNLHKRTKNKIQYLYSFKMCCYQQMEQHPQLLKFLSYYTTIPRTVTKTYLLTHTTTNHTLLIVYRVKVSIINSQKPLEAEAKKPKAKEVPFLLCCCNLQFILR